ncbi:MAG TPA: DNA-binding protein [Gammaproteobacteria bacterium]|nr:DNA-binding protein [Gammaproteobacteria bacterium]
MAATASAVKTREAVRDAADALLTEGVRPSVNAIRARLGRGSDTTIASALNDWWKELGQRVTDLESRPDVPEAVWNVADTL